MAISVANAKKLEWLWREENKIEFIETFMTINDKNGNPVPFILTDEQRHLVSNLSSKNIIDKARQLGISSITIALSLRACIVKPNTNCLLVSHTQSSTNAVFAKLKDMYHALPTWLRPETLTNNRQALTFANNSSITCLTAGNKEIGRGSTYNSIVHLSEYAFWSEPEKHLNALMQACSDSATIIIESTANGYNSFSELFFGAERGENAFKSFFYSWVDGGALYQGIYKQAVDEYLALNNNKMLTVGELDGEERNLMDMGATIEQLIWRRSKIGVTGIDKFKQEYPATPDESFIATGHSVFDKENIQKKMNAVLKVKPLENVKGLPQLLQPYLGNAFKMYETVKKGKRYYLGCDLSEGLSKDLLVLFSMCANRSVFIFITIK